MNIGLMSLLVQNQFGVLTRITGLFGRRGYNITALSVGETEDPGLSRITIITRGDADKLNQIYYQVSKLEEVVAASLLPYENALISELALIKVKNPPDKAYGTQTRLPEGGVAVRVTGTPQEIDAAIESLRLCGIVEMSRTGPTALANSAGALQHTKNEEAF